MTWGELHAALRDRGLLAPGSGSDAVSDAFARTPVTGVAYDSRHVQPGDVFVALRGQHADGSTFVPEAIRRGAVAVIAQEEGPSTPGVAVGARDERPGRACRDCRGAAPRSEPAHVGGGHHGHQRQDDHRASDGVDFRSGWSQVRAARNGRLPHRQSDATRDTHDARGPRRAGAARGDGGKGLRCVRHGSIVARAGARPRRGHALRRRRLHEPDARSPGLPLGHGGLLPGEAPSVRVASARSPGDHQCRRSPRDGAHRHRWTSHHVRHLPSSRRESDPVVVLVEGADFPGKDASRHAQPAVGVGRPSERLQHPRGCGDGRGARHSW